MSSDGKNEIDAGRLIIFGVGALLSALFSVDFSDNLKSSKEALSAAAGVCATFSGFIIAVLTILGDATALLPGSWRLISVQNREISSRFTRLQFIFFVFLLATFLSIFELATLDSAGAFVEIIRHLDSFFVSYSFFSAFELPRALKSIQVERARAVIESRQKKPTDP